MTPFHKSDVRPAPALRRQTFHCDKELVLESDILWSSGTPRMASPRNDRKPPSKLFAGMIWLPLRR